MNKLFKTSDEKKRRRCDKSIHKDMRIPGDIHQTNKKFAVTVQPKNACKLEFTDHLWLPFLDKPQSDIVVFVIIIFQIYNNLVTKFKHGIVRNYIVPFNVELEFLSASIIELFHIYESSHKNAIVIFITKNN